MIATPHREEEEEEEWEKALVGGVCGCVLYQCNDVGPMKCLSIKCKYGHILKWRLPSENRHHTHSRTHTHTHTHCWLVTSVAKHRAKVSTDMWNTESVENTAYLIFFPLFKN